MTVGSQSSAGYQAVKDLVDLVLGVVLGVLFSPIIILALVIVRITSPGPALYTQVRVGRNGRTFTMFKMRTMYHRCEEASGPRWSPVKGDSRVTPVGRFLRRTKIDELPQLLNVVLGEMSLIGPRPERPVFASQLDLVIPHYQRRLDVRPGLTGLAQIQLPPDTDLASVERKLACDLYYIKHLGPWIDLQIILCTISYLMGVPFNHVKQALQVPDGPIVEAEYQEMNRPGPHAVTPREHEEACF